ncbi:MAG: Rieske (2Fe-2S) protein [Pseudomonadota bacterium]
MTTDLRYEYCPPSQGSRLDHVGTYKRRVPVSLERMYENALDWEHLPHLHASSFSNLNVIKSGGWGWRAQVTNHRGQPSLLELSLDRSCRRWITRNLDGPSVGAEIWTHVFEVEPRQLDLVIDFFVPGVPCEAREKVGRAYAAAYELLYDEDVWMMTERQRALDQRLDSTQSSTLAIAKPDEVELPTQISLSGRDYYLNKHQHEWVVYPTLCPHQLGPLNGGIDEHGVIYCPWHGYGFDVKTGACTTGSKCRFGKTPAVTDMGDKLELTL